MEGTEEGRGESVSREGAGSATLLGVREAQLLQLLLGLTPQVPPPTPRPAHHSDLTSSVLLCFSRSAQGPPASGLWGGGEDPVCEQCNCL